MFDILKSSSEYVRKLNYRKITARIIFLEDYSQKSEINLLNLTEEIYSPGVRNNKEIGNHQYT